MEVIVYDHHLNHNEWFVWAVLTVSLIIIFILPSKFSRSESFIYCLFGVFVGLLFDHTISIEPIDFYDVSDYSKYEINDFLTYLMYGPFGYFFVYIYHVLKIRLRYSFFYILAWSLLSLGMERIGVLMNLYHYKSGYKISYSIPVYLLVNTILTFLFLKIRKEVNRQKAD